MDVLPGIELSRHFFHQVVEPALARDFPRLRYAAALIGFGSEVLGFDDPMSRDHNWGPRVRIFLAEGDFPLAPRLLEAVAAALPKRFLGAPIRYRRTYPGLNAPDGLGSGEHGVELHTLDFLRSHLGVGPDAPSGPLEWLAIPEHHLLEATAGAVFRDDHGRLTALRERLAWYPQDVWLYRLAAQWGRIAEERAFVGRTGLVGDDLGSRVIAARLARDLMRITFLIERRYAPYAKWFGTAFQRLACAPDLTPLLTEALSADDWRAREAALAEAARRLADMQLGRRIPGATPPVVGPYYGRPFTVINADEIADGLRAAIADPELRTRSLFGAIDQFSDATPLLDEPAAARAVAGAIFPPLVPAKAGIHAASPPAEAANGSPPSRG